MLEKQSASEIANCWVRLLIIANNSLAYILCELSKLINKLCWSIKARVIPQIL